MSERSRTEEPRTATFETRHADAAAARTVAAALAPDNTPQIRTEADGDVVRTRIERDTTGGLHASADDYLVNVAAADAVVASARDVDDGTERGDGSDHSESSEHNDTHE
ncbi:KEOPS complex subunit Pcc1 [Halorarum salinum]|uniref:KEOPS complex Pcc1-like subunit n=1 Tax=Halorarum salinum TaxID=2743089 RepID=A0A7D5QAY5_9EURY|nr:KEOPS complex subunit Pcc1 [Halobaculum salinum]QLG62777.1 hypothetical protein HUG12_13990 [Halobaculum salinum]